MLFLVLVVVCDVVIIPHTTAIGTMYFMISYVLFIVYNAVVCKATACKNCYPRLLILVAVVYKEL
jgi:hypothetical protein